MSVQTGGMGGRGQHNPPESTKIALPELSALATVRLESVKGSAALAPCPTCTPAEAQQQLLLATLANQNEELCAHLQKLSKMSDTWEIRFLEYNAWFKEFQVWFKQNWM
eukprot:COSAG05_NODE_551_length_8736_cov_5.409401_7_plen_109_part_00